MKRYLLLISVALCMTFGNVHAQSPMIYTKQVKGKYTETYKKIFTALETNGYFVVFEPNMGKTLAHFSERWGKEYNKNKFEHIRSIVFCNSWYANKIGNADPEMFALCPLSISLIHKEGVTNILFVRPSRIAIESPAENVVLELEQDVIRVIEEAVSR